ncbi:MAG: hypothetical protein R3F56_15435 [Planctomycetota bacterium]
MKTGAYRWAWLALPLVVLGLVPGWFGGDEVQLVEAGRQAAVPTPHYGAQALFYRPLAWHALALQLSWLGSWPRLVHSLDVLHHLLNAQLLARLLGRTCPQLRRGPVFLAFAVSPLALGAAGWSAAAVDRFALTGMLAAASCVLAAAGGPPAARVLGAGLLTAVALMCKETAVVLPAQLAVIWWWRPSAVDRRAWAMVAAIVALYLAWRWFGYFAHVAPSAASPAYAMSLAPARLASNAAIYAAAPFPPWIANIELLRRQPEQHLWAIGFGAGLHGLLVWMLARATTNRLALAYVAAYTVAVAPMLPLAKVELHYTYVAALPFAVVVARLWDSHLTRTRRTLLVLTLASVWARGVGISLKLWRHGTVEAVARAALAQHPPPAAGTTVVVAGEPGAPLSVLDRAFAGVPTVEGWRVVVMPDATPRPMAEWCLRLATDGAVTLLPPAR